MVARKGKGWKYEAHYVCSGCGACYFHDKQGAIECEECDKKKELGLEDSKNG